MLHWQLSGKHKFLAQLFCFATAAHLIFLFIIFFLYRGDLYQRHLAVTIPLDANIVLMPFQKSLLGRGGSPKRSSVPSQQNDPVESDPENESATIEPEKVIEPTKTGQITTLDNGELARKKKARDGEIKRKKKLAREKKERALREKKKKELAKKKALEDKKNLEQKLAEDKKAAEEKKKLAQKLAEQKKTTDSKTTPKKPEQPEPVKEPQTAQPELEASNDINDPNIGVGGTGDGPFYVGQYDLETIQLAQAVAAEVAQVWHPPAGFKNKSCTVRCVLDWDGNMISLAFEQSSGSPVFDISVKQAITKMKFPKELYGKEIILPFTA